MKKPRPQFAYFRQSCQHFPKRKGITGMKTRNNKPIKLEELTMEEKMKYEIAEELGLLDQVLNEGWRSLSSKETGRIGGLLARRKRSETKSNKSITNIN